MMRFRFLVLLLAIAVSTLPSSFAQTSQGQISGQVTDSSGGVLPGVKVTIENLGTHAQRVLETNQAGDYVAPGLDAGVYSVKVETKSFKSAIRDRVQIEVGLAVRADFQLSPGDVTQTVEVTTDAPLTDTTDSTLNGVLSNKAITELPVQGRDFQNLLMLHPGVQRTPGGGFQSITSNGNRPDDNNFYIDGADDMDVYYGESVMNDAGIEGTPASLLPLDSIQEFNTQESPEADYGVKPGVVMNIGIKSGTNAIHGSAYYYNRTSAFDARNFFNNVGTPVSALTMNEFGASVGGPIKKDKWFYFFNYEGLRDTVGNPFVADSPVTVSLVPQTAQLAQLGLIPADVSIVDALASCPPPGCSPLSQHLSALFLPNPGFTQNQSDPAAIDFDFNNTNRNDNVVAKTDYILNQHNTLSARFIYSNTSEIEEDTVPIRPEWRSTAKPITQVFGADWTWTPNSQWVNQARFSYNYFWEAILPLDHNVNPLTGYGINTGVTNPQLFGFPRIGLGSGFSCCYMGGNSGWPLETTPSRTENFSDTASFTRGKHTLRFGGNFRYGSVDYFRATEGRGRVDFDSLEDFAAGNVEKWELLYGNPKRDVSLKSVGFFIQDQYRIRPHVTLNIGLRYDITAPIEDSNNQLANFVPTGPNPGIIQVGKGISSPYPTRYNNVSPRLGVAWDIFGTGKTVLRAGGGIIFEQPSIRTFMFSGGGLNLNPTAASLGVTPGNGNITNFLDISDDPTLVNWPTAANPNPGVIFPSGVGPGSGCTAPFAPGNVSPPEVSGNPCSIFATTHLRTPYVANWNVNIQQAVSRDATLQVAYVANRGIDLYGNIDENQPITSISVPCINATGGFFDGDFSDCEQAARPFLLNCPTSMNVGGIGRGGPCFPYLGQVDLLDNQSSSIYHSLQVTFTKKYSHGLYLLAGYTYAHAIDTATNNLAPFPQNSLNFAGERGNSDFDIRNRFTLSATYELPSRDAKWQMLKGWEVTSIVTLQGGEPFTLNDFEDDNSATGIFEDRWDISGSPSNIHWSTSTPIPFIDPSTFTVDGSGNVIGGNSQCIGAAQKAGGQGAVNMLANDGCYIQNGTVLTAPAFGSFGNNGRNSFRGPTFMNWDFSVSKLWTLNDRLKLQLRGEVFDILNHPNFDVFTMNNDLFSPSNAGTVIATPDVASSNPVIGSGGSRHIQLGARFTW